MNNLDLIPNKNLGVTINREMFYSFCESIKRVIDLIPDNKIPEESLYKTDIDYIHAFLETEYAYKKAREEQKEAGFYRSKAKKLNALDVAESFNKEYEEKKALAEKIQRDWNKILKKYNVF